MYFKNDDEVGMEIQPLTERERELATIIAGCTLSYYRIAAECDPHAAEIARNKLIDINVALSRFDG